ncbi:MAG: 4-alpha-glucanotransferase, partial [Pseudomonadota bacterium]
TLLIALDQVPELMPSEAARQLLNDSDTLQRLRASDLVDYPAVADFKLQVLETLFKAFLAGPPTTPTRVAFERFRKASGDALEHHAHFEAIGDFLATSGSPRTAWQDWPEALRSPTSPEVKAFAVQHDERVTFFAWLQWLADHQLERAQSTATAAGGALGLYLDLAVGAAPDGAEAWSDQDVLVADVRIGAPPDDFNPAGQDWGLLPLSPTTLQARAYRPFIQLLRRNMRHAGALRIDHVLGLARSFWQPADKSAPGAYIRYPMEDLLGIVALESWRQRCVVIGEDLGTVPRELRSALDRRGLLGCRLLYFEREDDGTFKPAANYPKASITSTGTHDLPTLSGFWEGRDIKVREDLGLITNPEQARSERATRQATRQALLKLLADEALLPPNVSPEDPPETLTWQLVLAFHTFLGRTPATLRIVQLEDAVGARDQANLPGTVDEYPNWRRKVGHDLEHLTLDERLSLLLKAVSRANPPRAERTGEPRHNESGDDT